MTGAELNSKRRKALIPQQGLAALLGVSQGTIHNWEAGYRPIPDDMEKKIKAALAAKNKKEERR